MNFLISPASHVSWFSDPGCIRFMNYFGRAGILSGRASDGIGAAAPVKPRCLGQRRGMGELRSLEEMREK